MSKGEADYVTSSIGQIAFLMWHDIFPDDLTFEPYRACLYKSKKINWAEMINSYWMGEKIPTCELSEYIVVAKRILDEGEIDRRWYREAKEAVKDVREGVCLCVKHHRFGIESAHEDPLWFREWLEENRWEDYAYLYTVKNQIKKWTLEDMEKQLEELNKIINEK